VDGICILHTWKMGSDISVMT